MSSLTREQKRAILARDGGKCVYCGTPLTYDLVPASSGKGFTSPEGFEYPNLDHVIPRSKGGADGAENRASSCSSCNSSKGARSVEEFTSKRAEAGQS